MQLNVRWSFECEYRVGSSQRPSSDQAVSSQRPVTKYLNKPIWQAGSSCHICSLNAKAMALKATAIPEKLRNHRPGKMVAGFKVQKWSGGGVVRRKYLPVRMAITAQTGKKV